MPRKFTGNSPGRPRQKRFEENGTPILSGRQPDAVKAEIECRKKSGLWATAREVAEEVSQRTGTKLSGRGVHKFRTAKWYLEARDRAAEFSEQAKWVAVKDALAAWLDKKDEADAAIEIQFKERERDLIPVFETKDGERRQTNIGRWIGLHRERLAWLRRSDD